MPTVDSDAMLRSVKAGKRVVLSDVGLFADGTAVKQVGVETFRLARALVDDYVVVDTDAVCAAIKDVFQDTRCILEPSGAMGVAALKQYAETFGADRRGWVFLTGDSQAIRDVTHRYGAFAAKTVKGDVDHTFLTSIVDRNGMLRVQYLGVRFDPDEFRRDLLSLLKER